MGRAGLDTGLGYFCGLGTMGALIQAVWLGYLACCFEIEHEALKSGLPFEIRLGALKSGMRL